MNTEKGIGNGMGNANGFGLSHKDDRWAVNDRRRDDDYHRNTSSRRTRRSLSRSRSPRRSRRSKSRSRSPPPVLDRHDRHDRRSSRSPPRYRTDRVGDDSSSKWPSSNGRNSGFSSRGRGSIEDPGRRVMNREMAAVEASKRSVKENRVYVGNLAFSVKWSDLKDFMREVGSVVFAEVMVLPNGMSKGCGVVEFSTRAEAERAIKELNDTTLFGRQVFVREDREEEARYGSLAVSGFGARGGLVGGVGGRGGFGGGPPGGHSSFAAAAVPCKQLAVSGLPFNVGWQDLKDMFRSAGNIIRADVYFGADGSPTGNGMVVFETARDAQNAISMFNGFEYEGRTMEVREDRAATINSGFRGGSRGSSRGSFGVRGGRGGLRGGFGGGYGGPGGRDTTNLYSDYSGQSGPIAGPGLRNGPSGGVGRAPFSGPSLIIQPNQQIFVKNLPWSTSNEDLVELFQTTGKVQNAEVLFEAGRSKGVGVVEFETVEEAETAIAKFQSYSYGGRPLSLEFNGRWRDFSAVAPGHSGL